MPQPQPAPPHAAATPSRNAAIRRPVPPPVAPGASDATRLHAHGTSPATAPHPAPTTPIRTTGPTAPTAPTTQTGPDGLPPATLAARQCYLRHTAPVPGSRSGFRQLGPVRMLVCFWQDRMSLLQIHSDARRAGHGSRAMALLVAIAELHGLHIVANALPLAHGGGCLDQRTLTAWYLGFGFEHIPGSSMNAIIYSPTRRHRPEPAD